MEKLRWKNAQKKNLNRILWTINALLDSEEKKRKYDIIKDIKNLFRLRKEIDNSANKDIKIFLDLKVNETINDKIIR